jgi:hypothetical protein
MSIKNRDVYGYRVSGEDDVKEGVDYLDNDIQREEARVFFDQAKNKGSVQFEDDKGHNYTLVYKKDGVYWVDKRAPDSKGWF